MPAHSTVSAGPDSLLGELSGLGTVAWAKGLVFVEAWPWDGGVCVATVGTGTHKGSFWRVVPDLAASILGCAECPWVGSLNWV